MKRIISIFLILFCIIFNSWAFNLRSFIGKEVFINTTENSYSGIVKDVLEMQVCKQYDQFGNCIEVKKYQSVVLITEDGVVIVIPDRSIKNIEEIDG